MYWNKQYNLIRQEIKDHNLRDLIVPVLRSYSLGDLITPVLCIVIWREKERESLRIKRESVKKILTQQVCQGASLP